MSDRARKITRVMTILIGAALIGFFALRVFYAYNNFHHRMAEDDVRIADIQKDILIYRSKLEDKHTEVYGSLDLVRSMNGAGAAVADLQNKYMRLAYKAGGVSHTNTHGINQEIDAVIEQLETYFDDLGGNFVWYGADDGTNAQWICVTNYDFVGDALDVMWACIATNSGTSRVFAYATSVYDVPSGKFSTPSVHLTT